MVLYVRKTNHMLLSKRKIFKVVLVLELYLSKQSTQPTVESRGILRNPSDSGVRLSLILEGEAKIRKV